MGRVNVHQAERRSSTAARKHHQDQKPPSPHRLRQRYRAEVEDLEERCFVRSGN